MPDSPEAPTVAPEPAAPPVRDPRVPFAPVVIMKNGTTSSAFDKEVHRASVDAERRRQEQDADRQAASVGIEQGGAVRKTLDMGLPGNHPVAVLWCPTRDGSRERFMVCDLVDGEADGEVILTLVMICPRCMDRGVPMDQAQMSIRTNHRVWYLDTKTKGLPFRDPDTQELHILAGTITGPGPYTCSGMGCGFKFSIDPKSEYPGVSRLVLH